MDTSEEYQEMVDCPEIQKMSGDSISSLWIPMQDQIQEMMYKNQGYSMLSDFYHFWKEEECMNWDCNSQEKAWLCFYMCVEHKKKWDSEKEKWVKSAKE